MSAETVHMVVIGGGAAPSVTAVSVDRRGTLEHMAASRRPQSASAELPRHPLGQEQ